MPLSGVRFLVVAPKNIGELMLILKAFVNYDQIDEIWVQQVEQLDGPVRGYKIRKPEIDLPLIYHRRSAGWRALTIKVLNVLEKEKPNIRR